MQNFKLLVIFGLGLIYQNAHSFPQTSRKTARIVGGDAAFGGQFPFSAALTVRTSNSAFFCGGALINNLWVITAAHCVDGATSISIRLGSNHLNGDDANSLTLATTHYVLHPNFSSSGLANNIALVRFRLPIEFSNSIQPIPLPTDDVPAYAYFTAIGWGQTSDSLPSLADALRYVSLITISNEECMNVYGFQVTSDMVCAAGNYNEGTCIGDTGSPLIQHIYNPQGIRHAGVASFISGNGCDQPHPSGYARTYLFLDWINEVIANDQYNN